MSDKRDSVTIVEIYTYVSQEIGLVKNAIEFEVDLCIGWMLYTQLATCNLQLVEPVGGGVSYERSRHRSTILLPQSRLYDTSSLVPQDVVRPLLKC